MSAVEAVARAGVYVASRVRHAAMWQLERERGARITSSWIDEAGEGETASLSELWERITREVLSSERLVFFATEGDPPFKGAFIEIGIALGAGIPVTAVIDRIELEPRSFRPIGSWLNHPLVTMALSLRAALSEKP